MEQDHLQIKQLQIKQREQEKQQQNKKNSRKSILKKKRLSVALNLKKLDLKHIVNINDTWFINQSTLKDPEGSQQNIQRAMFRYKMISKIVLNNSFVGLQLKKVDENYLPPEYFFQRFRSLGDKNIAAIADHLQNFYNAFNQIQINQNQEQISKERKEDIKLLNEFLQLMDGKMYTIYYVEMNKCGLNLKNIFFSVNLLQALGWNIKKVALDFLKYRHVFFEIFSPKYYKSYIEMCLNNYVKAQQVQRDFTLTKQQKIQKTTIYFDDQVIREVQTENGIYQQFLKAKVKFSCPHPSFCCVEILQIIENTNQKILKKKKLHTDYMQMSSSEEIMSLKKLGFQSQFLESNQTKQIVQEIAQKRQVILEQEKEMKQNLSKMKLEDLQIQIKNQKNKSLEK